MTLVKTVSDSAVQTPRGSSFHHREARTEKNLDGYLGVTSHAVLEDQRKCGAMKDVINALRYEDADLFLAL